ncbi:MAG: hypothetical protein ABWX82_10645 [Leifsonia sp.]
MTDDHDPGMDARDRRIRALQRQLYAADARSDPEAQRRAATELRALENARRRDEAASGRGGDPGTPTGAGPGEPSAATDVDPVGPAAPDAPDLGARLDPRRRSYLTTGVAAAVALVIGIVIGVSASAAIGRSAPASDPSAPDSLAAFDRDQDAADRPHIDLSGSFRVGSFRLIANAGLDDLYLARDTSGRICLVAVIQTQDFSASCAAPDDLTPGGLRLLWTSLTPFRDIPGSQERANFAFTWQPDGTTAMQAGE